MKILFIEPFSDFPVKSLSSQIGINLGLLSIAAYTRSKIEDIELDFFSVQISKVLEDNISVIDVIKKDPPDILATTAITSSFPNAVEIMGEAKKYGSITILGGIFPSLNYKTILGNYPCVDFIICGEGERAFYLLIKNIKNKIKKYDIPGVAYKANEIIINNNFCERIDFPKLPSPAYDLAPIKKLIDNNIPIDIQTARGCFADCTYCSLVDLWGHKYTKKLNEQVYSEVKNLINNYGANTFRIVDDTFTLDRQRTLKLCEKLSDLDTKPNFFVLTRPDMVSKELFSSMTKAGINKILFGIETIDSKSLDSLNRKMKGGNDLTKRIEKLIFWSKLYDCVIHPTFMLGIPGETKQNLENMSAFLIKYKNENLIPFLIYFTPHPGTRIYKDINKLKIDILTKDISKYSHFYPVSVPKSLGKDALKAMVDCYNKIAIETNTIDYNPPLNLNLWEKEFDKNSRWYPFF